VATPAAFASFENAGEFIGEPVDPA